MPPLKFDTACLVTVVIDCETEEEGRRLLAERMEDGGTQAELEARGLTITCIAGWDDPKHMVRVPDEGDPETTHDLQKMRSSGDTALKAPDKSSPLRRPATDFRIDATAPTLPEDIERRNAADVEGILAGAHEICSLNADNDTDAWFLTRGGQFVRRTGEAADRFYIWPINEAFDFLDGIVADDAWDKVKSLLHDAGIALPPPHAENCVKLT